MSTLPVEGNQSTRRNRINFWYRALSNALTDSFHINHKGHESIRIGILRMEPTIYEMKDDCSDVTVLLSKPLEYYTP
jgi:hypothetical protein